MIYESLGQDNSVLWKDIIGYEGQYMVSSDGQVKSVKKFKKTSRDKNIFLYTNKDGYSVVRLSNNGVKKILPVHRLVAIAFLNKENDLYVVNHINGIRNDNRVQNLEWCSKRDNMIHAMNVLGVEILFCTTVVTV